MTDQVDYETLADEAAGTTPKELLKRLTALVRKQARLETKIEKLQAQASAAGEELRQISWVDIPELLDETGLSEVRLKDGTKVQIKDEVRVSTTGRYREKINSWLERTGNEDLIKNEITAAFPAGDRAKVERALKALAKAGVSQVDQKRFVNATTFAAFIRETLAGGELDVPMEEIGVHIQRITKLDKPKRK
jgi:hypothetical protein